MPPYVPLRMAAMLPTNPVSEYCLGIVRETLTINTTDGSSMALCMYSPSDIIMTKTDVIPCIVIVDTSNNRFSWEPVMYKYATHGFVVLVYTGRRRSKLEDMFSTREVTDLLSIHAYITSQFQWIRSNGVFIMGSSYASGIVLRCLAVDSNPYAGGIVLSPIPYISSVVSQDSNTIPVASHVTVSMILAEMGVDSISSHQFSCCSTPSGLRAQRILSIDRNDRARFDLSAIDIPIYVHVNIRDSLVNLKDSVDIFDRIKAKQGQSCIRYVQGEHGVSETQKLGTSDIYDDVLQWCRAVLHNGSTQTYRTEVSNSYTHHTTYTSIHPTQGTQQYRISDPRKVILSSYLPDVVRRPYLDRLMQHLSYTYLPIRSLLEIQRSILWNRMFKRSLDIAGFPIVTFLVDTDTPESGFGITLLEYDCFGYGRRLCSKYIMLNANHDKSHPVTVRMSMVASRIRFGHELVLVVSNYDHQFTYTGRTIATITFSDILLPYLFEY